MSLDLLHGSTSSTLRPLRQLYKACLLFVIVKT